MQKNIGNILKRGRYTSQVMRLAARLLINLRKCKKLEGGTSMWDYLKPELFEAIVEATLLTALQVLFIINIWQSPSNAITLGFDVKRMINVKLAIAIQDEDKGSWKIRSI